MRLLYFKYHNHLIEHPLNGFEQTFRNSTLVTTGVNPICLVGVNGSGKSKLLECLAEIFGIIYGSYTEFLPRPKRIKVEFIVEYGIKIDETWKYVKIENTLSSQLPIVSLGSDSSNITETLDKRKILKHLPSTIIGYTSGENESLSDFFTPYRDQYAEYYMQSAFEHRTAKKLSLPSFPQFLWVDYSMNHLVFISNALLGEAEKWKSIMGEAKLSSMRSFRLTIREKPRVGRNLLIRPAKEQIELIAKFKSCASTSTYFEKEKKTVLDFYVNTVTRKAFSDKFKTVFDLYLALLQIDLLNHVVLRSELDEMRRSESDEKERIDRPEPLSTRKAFHISQIKVWPAHSKSFIDYHDLSDGEHQFLHVFGTLLMAKTENILFLIDEPETHFNPQWRAGFISLMTKITDKRNQEYLITTHSPFLLSDSKRENVLIFERKESVINATIPDTETYGAAIDRLLQIAFDIAPPISLKSRTEVDKLIGKKNASLNELEKGLEKFGDSVQKLSIYQKIGELKNKKARKKKKSKK